MKLTKKQEAEVTKVYDSWLHSYLNGDVKNYDSYLDKDYHFIGSTNNEEFLNRKDTTQFFKDTAEQFSGKTKLKNQTTTIELFGELVFITHIFDAWFLYGKEWRYYSRFRFSSVLKEKKEGWKFIYQHFSVADSKTDEGETIGFDKVNIENQELREAIKRRTFELEQKNRELEIEPSLERVRSRSMAMLKSDELRQAGDLLCTEIKKLGIETITSGYVIMEDDENIGWNYAPNPHTGKILEMAVGVPHNDTAIMRSVKAAWKKQEPVFVVEMDEQETIIHQTFIAEQGINFPISAKMLIAASPPKLKLHNFNFKEGYLIIVGGTRLTNEQEGMMLRFSKVFQQTYRRFLDLQKAEAQAKEAQIEAALERVRSRSMAMHTSEELLDVITVVSEQLQNLEFKFVHVSFANNDMGQDYKFWTSSPGRSEPMRFNVPYKDIAVFNNLRKAQEKSLPFCTDVLTKKEHNQWHRHLLKHGGFEVFSKADNEFIMSRGMARSTAINPNIMLILGNYASIPYSEEENEIIARFGQVFEQAYTRFLDLQNAEALTKVAQIEAALEKVRSVALGLKKSDDMLDIAQVLYEQLLVLGFNDMRNAIIDIHNDDNETFIDYDYSHDMSSAITQFSFYGDPVIEQQIKTVQSSNDAFFEIELKGEQLKELIATRLLNGEKDDPRLHKIDHLTYNLYSFGNGAIGISNFGTLSDDQKKVLKRFRNVFTFAYKRYTDLATAEAQTREAQIEAALEKVRSVALGLNKSEELVNITEVLYNQLFTLGFKNIRNAIIDIHIDDKGGFLDYDYSPEMGKSITKMNYYDHPIIEKQVEEINASTDGFFEIILEGKDLEDLIALRIKNGEEVDERLLQITQLTYNLYSFGEGEIGISTFGLLEENQKTVLKRFRNVFSFAYNRYNELKEAETRASELRIDAALERVRSRTLAMQKSDELAETSVVVFKELLNLGIEPNRLFIGIINQADTSIEAWATNEDGTKISNHFTLNTERNDSVKKMYDGWLNNNKSITIDLTGIELQNYFHYLVDEMKIPFKNGLSQKRRVQTIAYFGQGLIGMASPEEQPLATTQLLERFAAVFNLTYTRFSDLKVAEAQTKQAEKDLVIIKKARKNAEKALVELKSTQKQLIQSEKMASLGELTAGIAHEIQNPLNFVNNFSEVSAELLAEMQDEINNGNLDEAKEILTDILQNLEKIIHHGKRADVIVKGMLQHSRSSSGAKEPTDINKLADEYLQLAYHGLRAKDKTFNATLITNYDETIGKINIIPQDIGRVILNMITNAFYATNEKLKSELKNYKPTVTIATKKLEKTVEISIKDNGKGIPKKVLDKIFQPFFTTKPTGQGTGLGLSLAYDIVKSHGGELNTELTGPGATFVICLPIK